MNYSNYFVESYFINVGAGDSAIHLLRHRNNQGVEAAVLIDGGRLSCEVPVSTVIEHVRVAVNHQFAFKAIVVTHWDVDHWKGLMNLLYQRWEAEQINPAAPNLATSYWDNNTTFYCPWAGVSALNQDKTMQVVLDQNLNTYKLQFKRAGGVWTDICWAVVSTYALGFDLFTGSHHANVNHDIRTVTQPAPLGDSMQQVFTDAPSLFNQTKPIFLIFGVDNFTFKVRDEPANWVVPDEGWKDVTDGKTKNNASIMALIIWPRQNLLDSFRVSLYTCGDASHHGSYSSTVEDLFLQNLQYFVVSAGKQHGHPNCNGQGFAVVYCFLALAQLMRQRNPQQNHAKMICTRHPYWLTWAPSQLGSGDFDPLTVFGWGDTALEILEIFQQLSRPNDCHFLRDYLRNNYEAVFKSALGYAYLARDENVTKEDFLNIINDEANGNHPMKLTPWPSPSSLLAGEKAFLTDTIREIRNLMAPTMVGFLEPGSDNTRGFQWIKLVARGDSPVIEREQQRISDTVLAIIKKGAQIFKEPNDIAWAWELDEQARTTDPKLTKAVNSLRTLCNPEKNPPTKMKPKIVGDENKITPPPGFSSVEEWISSVLTQGLTERVDIGHEVNEVFAETESVCAKWFSDCFTCAAFMRLVGNKTQEKLSLSQADILLRPNPDDSATITLSTSQDSRAKQFGAENVSSQSLLGFDNNFQGLLFAINGSHVLTMAQLAMIVSFPLSGNELISKLFNILQLSTYDGSRSGIWFMPQFNSRTIMRLAMKPKSQTELDELTKLLGERLGPIIISAVTVIGTCAVETRGPNHSETKATLGLQFDVSWTRPESGVPTFEGKASIDFSADGFDISFKLTNSGDVLDSLLAWAKTFMGGKTGQALRPSESSTPSIRERLSQTLGATNIVVHRVSVVFDKTMNPVRFEANLEIDARFSEGTVPFFATVCWKNGAFDLEAETWPISLCGNPTTARLYPFYEETALMGPSIADPVYEIKLISLLHLPAGVQIPPGLPDKVKHVEMMIGFSHGQIVASFSTVLECESPEQPSGLENESSVPLLSLERVNLDFSVGFSNQGSNEVDIRLDAYLKLSVAPGYKFPEASEPTQSLADFIILYQRRSQGYEWLASASIENLRVAHLCDLFSRDGSNHAILDVMGGINIAHASIKHQYSGKTALDINGSLHLGPAKSKHVVELDFNFSHKAQERNWTFTASIRPSSSKDTVKISSLLSGLVDETELPGFLRNMQVPMDKLKAELRCGKTTLSDQGAHVLFSLSITIGDFVLSLAQLRSIKAAKLSALARENNQLVSGTSDDTGPAKIIRFTVPPIGQLPEMPIVGAVKQPFDQLGIVWTNRALSKSEVDFLNRNVPMPVSLQSRDKNGTLARGLHFQIFLLGDKPRLILDHVFARIEPKRILASNEISRLQDQRKLITEEPQDSGKTIAPMSKTMGPLSISSMGVSLSGNSFSNILVSLDATANLGDVTLKMLGLTLAINLEGIRTLEDFKDLKFKPGITGIGVSFEKSQLRLAGLFTPFGSTEDSENGFMGAIAVSVDKWSAIAAGMYTETKPEKLKSMFAFGALRGTIFTVGSVEVNSLTGGFGYNSKLRLPSISQVARFPFIAMNSSISSPSGSLTEHLSTLRSGGKDAWVTIAPNNMWLAAGVGFKAFQTVDAQVLIALTLADEPKFAILAQATAVFPKGKSQERAFLVLDIDIASEIDPLHGTILVAGELTPKSFILNPSCRLTGGFALKIFLEGSPHSGDFVFTVGGYSNQFSAPSHYPAAPSRVGIMWRYDSQIYITGSAYFAITPQVAMGGGRMDLVVDKGWVHAVFTAWADFFIHYHPFSFALEVGITLWIEFSARLGLHGPPMAGFVHLHFWTYNTIVAFGPQLSRPSPLSWGQFLCMVKNLPIESSTSDEMKALNHMMRVTKGAVPVHESAKPNNNDKGSQQAVEIRATHVEFEVQARVPVLSVTVGVVDHIVTGGSSSLYARPMQQGAIADSHLKVYLKHKATTLPDVKLQIQNVVMKKVAPALWGEYKDTNPSAIASEAMIGHAMALDIRVKPKDPSGEKLPAIDIVQFNKTDLKHGNIEPITSDVRERFKRLDTGTEPVGHTHLLNAKRIAKEQDKRPQWVQDLVYRE
ncbi:hypothetical protein DER45DRAFT_544800 [Fusarium avenaceum]|nr:hypothetical protein DER45DRAFT_544800 [Fusarium avenaceum]